MNEVSERQKMDGARSPLTCSPFHSLVCITWITEHTLPVGHMCTHMLIYTETHMHKHFHALIQMHLYIPSSATGQSICAT